MAFFYGISDTKYSVRVSGVSFTIREGRKIVGKGKVESKIDNNA